MDNNSELMVRRDAWGNCRPWLTVDALQSFIGACEQPRYRLINARLIGRSLTAGAAALESIRRESIGRVNA
jgi:hypothetical protein